MNRICTFYDHVKTISSQQKISMAQALIQVKSLGIEALEIDQKHIIGREKELKQELNDAELSVSAICVACDLGRNTVMNAQTERLLEAAKLIGAKKC